jgi:hypothetical protein
MLYEREKAERYSKSSFFKCLEIAPALLCGSAL